MLSHEDNELICRTGPGTVMGSFMRQYWVPCMLSSELPAADSEPVRVLLLGEQLIAFRDSTGNVGLVQHSCPHRGASLFFGRNEESGLRCVYHGWKFDAQGNCVDMPNEPAESDFKQKVKAVAYPTQERGGLVWAYLGPRSGSNLPALPDLEANMVEGARPWARQSECNYLAVLEGNIDTAHASFLHWGSLEADDQPPDTFAQWVLTDRAPRYQASTTEAGTVYGAYRDASNGTSYWRIAHFILPFYALPPQGLLGAGPSNLTVAQVPMDDTHTMTFGIFGQRPVRPGEQKRPAWNNPGLLPNTSDWYGRFRPDSCLANDFLLDRDLQRSNAGGDGWTGIKGIPRQDQAMTVSMGPIYDRTSEHLGTSDLMVIQTRRRLLDAAKAFERTGQTPAGVDDPELYRVRAGGVILAQDADWLTATADLQRAFVDHPDLDWAVTGYGIAG